MVSADPVARLKSKLQPEASAPSRLDKLHAELHASQDIAKSAAHTGVVERPMNQRVVARPQEQNISHLTDRRREEVLGPSTSVARLGSDAADIQRDGAKGTSVARLGTEDASSQASSVARLNKTGSVGDLN